MAKKMGRTAALYIPTTDASVLNSGLAMDFVAGNSYKVNNPAKQFWDPDQPVVVYDSGSPITPVQVDCAGGWVHLSGPPAGAVTVDAYVLEATQVGGVQGFDLEIGFLTDEAGVFGDTAEKPEPVALNWKLSAKKMWWDNRATFSTNFAGVNNDIVLISRLPGELGNLLSFETFGGVSKTLAVMVSGFDIVVQLATDGLGTVTSTSNDVRAAIYDSRAAMRLISDCLNAAGNDGTGIPAVSAHAHFAGGADPDLAVRMIAAGKMLVAAYVDTTAGVKQRFEGIGRPTKIEDNIQWNKLIQEPMTFAGYDTIWWHEG